MVKYKMTATSIESKAPKAEKAKTDTKPKTETKTEVKTK